MLRVLPTPHVIVPQDFTAGVQAEVICAKLDSDMVLRFFYYFIRPITP